MFVRNPIFDLESMSDDHNYRYFLKMRERESKINTNQYFQLNFKKYYLSMT